MKTHKSLFVWSAALLCVVAFQNCGQFDSVKLQALGAGSGGGGEEDVGGLPLGLQQPGAMFKRDPGTAAGNDSLAFSANLAPFVTPVQISHLKDVSFLSDGYISFSADTAYPTKIASPKNSLAFVPSDPRFQQVNAYYQIDRLINALVKRNDFPAAYPELKVDAHCTTGAAAQNNAYYSFDDHTLCLGYSDVSSTRVWAADDADVTVHEFGHSLNHKFSTTEILGSTTDMSALDEGFADLWAYQQNQDVRISSWFGRAIYTSIGMVTSPFPGLRNLANVMQYPTDAVYEIHTDSLFLSGAMAEVIRGAGLSSGDAASLKRRTLESLQKGFSVGEAASAFRDQAASFGISAVSVNSALSSRGLLRRDLASELRLDPTKPVYVIDNHMLPDYQSNGNCNGALDVGEAVFIYPNLANTGGAKGGVRVELATSTTGVTILAGGDFGFFHRMPASNRFRDAELVGLTKSSDDYLMRMIGASFGVQVAAGTVSPAHFTMKITSTNTLTNDVESNTVAFDLPVGAVANISGNCPANGESSVLP